MKSSGRMDLMKSSGGMDVMKSCGGMDLEEWELVADGDEEGFLERIINIGTNTSTTTSLSHVINHFHYSYCPPPLEFAHKTGPSNQLLLLPPPPPPPVSIDHLKTMVQPPPPAEGGGGGGAWEESSIISTLEEEDHDVSSPKFTSDFNQFDHPCKQVVVVVDSEMDKGITAVKEEDGAEEGGAGGLFKIWKWGINYNKISVRIGGAICSFAAICIMSLSCTRNINNDQTKLHHHHFQIYTTATNDHRHKQVVVHRANEALISTRGRIPFIATAARITFGGYYDASASI